jgi:hypothetical protein
LSLEINPGWYSYVGVHSEFNLEQLRSLYLTGPLVTLRLVEHFCDSTVALKDLRFEVAPNAPWKDMQTTLNCFNTILSKHQSLRSVHSVFLVPELPYFSFSDTFSIIDQEKSFEMRFKKIVGFLDEFVLRFNRYPLPAQLDWETYPASWETPMNAFFSVAKSICRMRSRHLK